MNRGRKGERVKHYEGCYYETLRDLQLVDEMSILILFEEPKFRAPVVPSVTASILQNHSMLVYNII